MQATPAAIEMELLLNARGELAIAQNLGTPPLRRRSLNKLVCVATGRPAVGKVSYRVFALK